MAVAERFSGANVFEAGRLSPFWGEHVARYVFALGYTNGKFVLDIACGTGYGLGYLKRDAALVTGVDVSIDAAIESKKEWDRSTSALVANGLSLPFVDECFDVITSFETIEHLHGRREFLAELKRVLHRDGKLILSTPNANYTKPVNGKPTNPFHIFEYLPEELRTELEAQFHLEGFYGQSLNAAIKIPPFQDAQRRLPKDLLTQTRLFSWRVFNKLPLQIRETLSEMIWKKPFYPMEHDYVFDPETVETAPVLVAICSKNEE